MSFEHDHYSLHYDRIKNRVYVELRGFLQSVDKVPDLLNHWKETLTKTQKGFTLLVDAREMSAPPPEIADLFAQVQRLVQKAGMVRRAEVLAKSAIGRLAAQNISETTGIHALSRKFQTMEDAEVWLDEVK